MKSLQESTIYNAKNVTRVLSVQRKKHSSFIITFRDYIQESCEN